MLTSHRLLKKKILRFLIEKNCFVSPGSMQDDVQPVTPKPWGHLCQCFVARTLFPGQSSAYKWYNCSCADRVTNNPAADIISSNR